MHTCDICCKSFKYKYLLDRHINKKTKCSVKDNINKVNIIDNVINNIITDNNNTNTNNTNNTNNANANANANTNTNTNVILRYINITITNIICIIFI